MTVEELTDAVGPLGYDVDAMGDDGPWIVRGHERAWPVMPGDDLDAFVRRATNHARLVEKMEQAQTYFAENYATWSTLTAGQKDAANRQAQRALSNLIRHVRGDLETDGV